MKNFLKSASAFVLMLGAAVMLFTACDKKTWIKPSSKR